MTGSAARDYLLDDQSGFLLRRANQRHTAIFQAHAVPGLTPMQFAALQRLHEQGASSQNQLGRLAAMDIATIKGVVDRLREKGLVETKPSPEDRRRSLVCLTDAGRALLKEMHILGRAITAETLEGLSSKEAKTLLRLLRKIA